MAKSLNEQLKSTLSALKKRTDFTACVKVGFDETPHSSGFSASELARVLNFGDGGFIPARPFMSIDFPENLKSSGELKELVRFFIESLVESISKKKVLDSMGEYLAKSLKKFILSNPYSGSSLGNAPSTIRKKKKDHPLVDTGELASMATYVVSKS